MDMCRTGRIKDCRYHQMRPLGLLLNIYLNSPISIPYECVLDGDKLRNVNELDERFMSRRTGPFAGSGSFWFSS